MVPSPHTLTLVVESYYWGGAYTHIQHLVMGLRRTAPVISDVETDAVSGAAVSCYGAICD